MKEDEEDPRTVKCADLLAPEGYGEMIGGSERETDVAKLINRMNALNIPTETYEWYLDLRRFGSVPHSGFGLGIERCAVDLQAGAHPRCDPIPACNEQGLSVIFMRSPETP